MSKTRGLAALLLASVACPGASTRSPGAPSHDDSSPESDIVESVYLDGVQKGWQESGSATRDVRDGSPAQVQFGETGEWIFTRPGLRETFGALVFRVKEPDGEGEFLQVRLGSGAARPLRAVKLIPDHCSSMGGGWTFVRIPMAELDPEGVPFDTIVFEPFRPFGNNWVTFDRIGLTKAGDVPRTANISRPTTASGATAGAPPVAAPPSFGKPARIHVDCRANSAPISPYIYGVAGTGDAWINLESSARRWGGNPTSRYNWEGHFWNTAQDWFFENQSAPPYDTFLTESTSHGALSAVTVPMLGWVAKDATSYSFPISAYGAQAASDQWRPDAGNGIGPGGGPIAPGSPTRTSVPAPPDWAKRWVSAIVARDAKAGKRSVYEYILDNEPMLWSSTHRDVHPEPLGYDELLDRSIQYASAIRTADRDAVIAGPAEWGWSGYLYSAKDLAPGGQHLDRLRHGDVPLVEWYLREMRKAEQKTGSRLLDVLDLHYYPQANNVYGGGGGGTDTQTQLLRLRSTRSLWDPTYVDESWIKESIRLLPRMKEWVDRNYPGRGISIGEWNFGGEKDITGALATAEALGRFAQFGVTSAFYWTAPPAGSPSRMGFLAYRNFDGKGGRFLDWYVPAASSEGASVFASRDQSGKHLVLVMINMDPDTQLNAEIDLSSCGIAESHQVYSYARDAGRFSPSPPVKDDNSPLREALAPWSITVIDLHLRDAGESK
jgi:hypothetical protein